jgi:hypothetical protein
MKTAIILAIVGLAIIAFLNSPMHSSRVEAEFRNFIENHNVGYGTINEYSYRLGVFAENLNRIDELSKLNPLATFAINKFADRTPEEMKRYMGLYIPADRNTNGVHIPADEGVNADWTKMWDTVKDQGQWGSCWAFSATAAFESRYQIAHGSHHVDKVFSEQQLVDCDPNSEGCDGGYMDYAFEYLETHWFCTESQYPYTAIDGTWKDSKCSDGPKDKGHQDIRAKNEAALLKELVNGPVSVAVDASSWSFYTKGILTSCTKSLNHGVTLVASDFNEKWVRIRNSWGPDWGEEGYIRLAINKDTCGYADAASYPIF